jgi:hypothetical protein
MVLNFVLTLSLTRFFPPPSEKVREMIERIREPEDENALTESDSSPEH